MQPTTSARPIPAGVPNRPLVSLTLFVAAAAGMAAWPRFARGAELVTLLGRASDLLWVPFALAALAELVLLVGPRVAILAEGPARRAATAHLVGGLRALARAAVWGLLAVACFGPDPATWPNAIGGSLLDLALSALAVLTVVLAIPAASRELDRLDPSKAQTVAMAGRGPRADRPMGGPPAPGGGTPGIRLDHPLAPATSAGALFARQLRSAARWVLGWILPWGRAVLMGVGRWTLYGVAALEPRLGSDPRATLERGKAQAATRRAAQAAHGPGAGSAAAAGGGAGPWHPLAALRALLAGDPERPVLYGPASIWTEELPAAAVAAAAPGTPARPGRGTLLTRSQLLRAHLLRNDPAAAELCEIGNALLVAAHTDALQHGNSRAARDAAGMPPELLDDGPFDALAMAALPPALEVGKRLLILRAWARPDYFAYILGTAPVVANDILARLTTSNLAANVAAHSRFTRSQVLAWLHTEHDPGDIRAEAVADDPARGGVVGVFVVFDRGDARRAPGAEAGPADADAADDEVAGSPFADAPW